MTIPSSYEWNRMIQVYAICFAFLLIKYIFSTIYAVNKNNRPPEDKNMLPLAAVPEDLLRRERQLANDMENIPFYSSLLWGAFLVQCLANASGGTYSKSCTVGLTVLIVIYTGSRFLYTIFYVFALQPYRSIAYSLALGAVAAATAILIIAAFDCDMNKAFPFYNNY